MKNIKENNIQKDKALSKACHGLGWLYDEGQGVEKDYKKPLNIMRWVARLGISKVVPLLD